MKSRDGKSKRREEKRREEKKKEDPKKRQSEERRSKCAKRKESRETLRFSNDLWIRSTKAASAEPSGQMRDEKLHAVVARSTFPSEKAKNTSRSEHFWKLRCRKSAHRCGTKHISK